MGGAGTAAFAGFVEVEEAGTEGADGGSGFDDPLDGAGTAGFAVFFELGAAGVAGFVGCVEAAGVVAVAFDEAGLDIFCEGDAAVTTGLDDCGCFGGPDTAGSDGFDAAAGADTAGFWGFVGADATDFDCGADAAGFDCCVLTGDTVEGFRACAEVDGAGTADWRLEPFEAETADVAEGDWAVAVDFAGFVEPLTAASAGFDDPLDPDGAAVGVTDEAGADGFGATAAVGEADTGGACAGDCCCITPAGFAAGVEAFPEAGEATACGRSTVSFGFVTGGCGRADVDGAADCGVPIAFDAGVEDADCTCTVGRDDSTASFAVVSFAGA